MPLVGPSGLFRREMAGVVSELRTVYSEFPTYQYITRVNGRLPRTTLAPKIGSSNGMQKTAPGRRIGYQRRDLRGVLSSAG